MVRRRWFSAWHGELLQTDGRAATVKLCGKAASVLLGLGYENTLHAREAVVHAPLRFGEVKVGVHTDELRGSNLLEADSPAN